MSITYIKSNKDGSSASGLLHGNYLLEGLPEAEASLVLPRLERVRLLQKECLIRAHQPIQRVYFLEEGWASVTASNGIRTVEVAVIGREGLVGVPLIVGVKSTTHTYVIERGGLAYRICAAVLMDLLPKMPELKTRILMFMHNLFTQASENTLGNAICSVEARVARCLLLCHDRAADSKLSITHEMLSLKVGSRRAGITNAIHMLEGEGIIRATRGSVTVLDRQRLEQSAAGSYGAAKLELWRCSRAWNASR